MAPASEKLPSHIGASVPHLLLPLCSSRRLQRLVRLSARQLQRPSRLHLWFPYSDLLVRLSDRQLHWPSRLHPFGCKALASYSMASSPSYPITSPRPICSLTLGTLMSPPQTPRTLLSPLPWLPPGSSLHYLQEKRKYSQLGSTQRLEPKWIQVTL